MAIADDIRIHHDPAKSENTGNPLATDSDTLYGLVTTAPDELTAGCLEMVGTVSRFFEVLPFTGMNTYMRTVFQTFFDTTAPADDPMAKAAALASTSKKIGRSFCDFLADTLVNGGSNIVIQMKWPTPGISFAKLEDLVAEVRAGHVDYLMMHQNDIREYAVLCRGAGTTLSADFVALPSGQTVPAFLGTPIFRNDYMPEHRALAGTFYQEYNDGRDPTGLAGFAPPKNFFTGHALSAGRWRVNMQTGISVFGDGQCICADFS